jgi:hypothetical protein
VSTLFLQGGLDRLFQLPVPTDEYTEILPVSKDGGEGLGEVLDAFLPAQPADVADEGRAVRQGGGDGEGVEIEEMLMGDENFVAVFRGSIRESVMIAQGSRSFGFGRTILSPPVKKIHFSALLEYLKT